MGDRLHRRTERSRSLAGCHLHGERPAALLADFVGDLLGLGGIDDRQEPAEQCQEKVVAQGRQAAEVSPEPAR